MSNEAFRQRQVLAAESESASRDENEGNVDAVSGDLTAYTCECSEDCDASVLLTLAEYEQVRAVPTHFLIAPGHLLVGVETVVGVTPRYEVVEKIGAAAPVATALDPRSHPQDERAAS